MDKDTTHASTILPLVQSVTQSIIYSELFPPNKKKWCDVRDRYHTCVEDCGGRTRARLDLVSPQSEWSTHRALGLNPASYSSLHVYRYGNCCPCKHRVVTRACPSNCGNRFWREFVLPRAFLKDSGIITNVADGLTDAAENSAEEPAAGFDPIMTSEMSEFQDVSIYLIFYLFITEQSDVVGVSLWGTQLK